MPRPSARKRGYTSRWDKARAAYLRRHPWCHMCEADGRRVKATVIDHIEPHRGDMRKFWNSANWQPLCTIHHSSTKQRMEKGGTVASCDESGLPRDKEHHWN